MPSFPIVDSHVHLYDPAHLRYSWLGNVPKINRRYDLADFDLCRDGVEADLEKLKRFRITKGIRRLIEIEMDPRICLEPGFLDAIRLLPKHGLTFDICV